MEVPQFLSEAAQQSRKSSGLASDLDLSLNSAVASWAGNITSRSLNFSPVEWKNLHDKVNARTA